MLYIIDSADIGLIKKCAEFYPIDGVTTNPTIISKEKTDFIKLITEIRSVIGPDKMFHIQTTSTECKDIVEEGLRLREMMGENFYLKIPVSPEGLKATMALKEQGVGITMTAIFTQQQALIGAKAGADFVAPYVNRLDNIVSDGVHVVSEIVDLFKAHNVDSMVLAASFKTAEQVHKIAMVGTHAITINPELFEQLVYHPLTLYAVDDFEADWASVYGNQKIIDMIK
ncbi:MAG: fructose-6-phosphate aldolase [Clostridia bacterium]|nr:fructose-6-phosphate aldolase [Clostridia bacterium]MBQ4601405.1 fructose-6-phosphate aldolase [Clostridia bacterium]